MWYEQPAAASSLETWLSTNEQCENMFTWFSACLTMSSVRWFIHLQVFTSKDTWIWQNLWLEWYKKVKHLIEKSFTSRCSPFFCATVTGGCVCCVSVCEYAQKERTDLDELWLYTPLLPSVNCVTQLFQMRNLCFVPNPQSQRSCFYSFTLPNSDRSIRHPWERRRAAACIRHSASPSPCVGLKLEPSVKRRCWDVTTHWFNLRNPPS